MVKSAKTKKHTIISDKLSIKKDSNNNKYIEGCAIVFNEWYESPNGRQERIFREALNGTVIEDVRLLYNHDWSKVLARQSTGGLKLYDDGKGLKFEARLTDTTTASDVYEQIDKGIIYQCSFDINLSDKDAMVVYTPEFNALTQTIHRIDQIEEISIVSLPSERKAYQKKNKNADKDNEMILEGYAIVFDEWSDISDGKRERISRSALSSSALDDVRLLFNHEWNKVLGRETAGTLKLTVDDKGLKFRASLVRTEVAHSIYENIKLKLYNRCGYGGQVEKIVDYNQDLKIYETTISHIKRIQEISVDPKGKYKNAVVWPGKRELTRKEKLQLLKIELELEDL